MNEHAILGGSNAHRWLICTPSARLERQFPDTAGESAKEGTFAHALAEMNLRAFLAESKAECAGWGKQIEELKSGKTVAGDYYDASMEEYVFEYIQTIIAKFAAAKKVDRDATLLLERKLDFSDWVPEGFGRADAVIIADGLLDVIDFKYGRNVAVSATDNPQMRLYALGAYKELDFIYDFDSVQMTIVQPRNGGTNSECLSLNALLEWGESIKPLAEAAYKGEGKLVTGPHCRFCRAAIRCRAQAEKQLEAARYEFKNADLLTDDEVADVLRRSEELTTWAHAVKEYASDQAINHGKQWPGYKIVAGRSSRKISDTEEAYRLLRVAGFEQEQLMKPAELQNLTKLEKLVGRKRLNELIGKLIVKPDGKPTLVPESDKRPAFNSAKEDFVEVPEDTTISSCKGVNHHGN